MLIVNVVPAGISEKEQIEALLGPYLVFKRFPGSWELQVYRKNRAGIRFWEKCFRIATTTKPIVDCIAGAGGHRIAYSCEA